MRFLYLFKTLFIQKLFHFNLLLYSKCSFIYCTIINECCLYILHKKTDSKGRGRICFLIYYYLFLKGKFMIKFCLSKFLFLLSCIIIKKKYELYFTFSCFLFGCFVKNYGIKKEVHYKLLIMSKISSPYQSHFFSPNPFIARSSSIVVGL